MPVYRILVASSASSVYTLVFDSEVRSLTLIASLDVGPQPTWITPHPTDNALVYVATRELDGGRIVALRADAEGRLEVVGETQSGGIDPCALVASRDELFVANYTSGTVSIITTSSSPPYFPSAPTPTQFQLVGNGPNIGRQASSHPHHIVVCEDQYHTRLLVPDLGADKTWGLTKKAEGCWALDDEGSHIVYQPGGGPRHAVTYDGTLYTVLELGNKITAHALPSPTSPFRLIAAASTFTAAVISSHPSSTSVPPRLASEILLASSSPSYPESWIYVSNRDCPHPEGDTIAVFRTLPKSPGNGSHAELERVAEISTNLLHLRGMILFGEDGRYIIAGGMNGGGVVVFERVQGGRVLQELARLGEDVGITRPTGFVCL